MQQVGGLLSAKAVEFKQTDCKTFEGEQKSRVDRYEAEGCMIKRHLKMRTVGPERVHEHESIYEFDLNRTNWANLSSDPRKSYGIDPSFKRLLSRTTLNGTTKEHTEPESSFGTEVEYNEFITPQKMSAAIEHLKTFCKGRAF
jgi:hypothetical protein